MKQIANDEFDVPFALMEDRTPTHALRLRDVGAGRVLLEQLWKSPYVGIKPQWVPIPMSEIKTPYNQSLEPTTQSPRNF